MEIPFIKMEANGNNYLLIQEECINKNINVSNLISKMSNKNYGIGADGALILSNTYRPIPYIEIFNSDGSKAKLCVNGLRIVSKYLFDTKINEKDTIKIKTDSGIYDILNVDNNIIVKLNSPNTYTEEIFYYNNKKYALLFLDIGNRNCYLINDGTINVNYFKNVLGRQLSLKYDANVGFITPLSKFSFSIITYERGSKLTLSCGSNICGAAAILEEKKMIERDTFVDVETMGGILKVKVNKNEIAFTGSINLICKGTFYF
ncbi:MAG: diaminopimelate epimerase [Haloplasmataceae bacterium]|jgi:diaminopimelate epimerase|nr:diaminopimelate epimerase [Haloplasmataceae bacterium]